MEEHKIISENDVKRITLRCLKTYYKYRPRGEGPTTARLDVRAAGGIIADGYLTFEGFDGNPFVATFEATSAATRDEVIYRVQPRLLFWDSLVAGMLVAACLLTINYEFDYYRVAEIGWWATIAGTIVLLFAGFYTYRLLLSKLPRYRYIYAVEQFKQYHANEQWVAIASDVFAHANDPKLKELKKQCVRNGFGLIKIEQDLEPYLLITPSRREVFKGRRKNLNFLDIDSWTERLRNQVKDNWWNFAGERFGFLRQREGVMRFRRTYYNQYLLVGLAMIIIGLIYWEEYRSARIRYADEDEFVEQMLVPGDEGYKSETTVYLIDTMFLDQFEKSRFHKPPKPEIEEESPPVEEEIPEAEIEEETASEEEPGLVANAGGEPVYDCARFYNLDSVQYILIYETVAEEERAIIELSKLKGKNIDANLLWLGCFSKKQEGFAIYLGLLYPDAEEAIKQQDAFAAELLAAGFEEPEIKIRTIIKR